MKKTMDIISEVDCADGLISGLIRGQKWQTITSLFPRETNQMYGSLI